jgi:hypothetical protein
MRLLRPAVIALVVLLGAWLIVAHGVRGLVIVIAGIVVYALPRTRGWKMIEGPLVRITGSRRRAAVISFGLLIAVMAAFDIYQLVR